MATLAVTTHPDPKMALGASLAYHLILGGELRRILPEGHRNAVFDATQDLWLESDRAFARRLLEEELRAFPLERI